MITVECDVCKKQIINPKRHKNYFQLYKDNKPDLDNSNAHKDCCKNCYLKWCKLYDDNDKDIENITKLTNERANELLGFKL
jgi:hypothetical protein